MNYNLVFTIIGLIVGPFVSAYLFVSFMSDSGFAGTGEGFWYDVGSIAGTIFFFGSIPYGLFVSYRYAKNRKSKLKTPI